MSTSGAKSNGAASDESAEIVLSDRGGTALGEPRAYDGDIGSAIDDPSSNVRRARSFSLALMWRFKWTVAASFVVIAGIVNAIAWTQLTPSYRAEATVRVAPIIPRLVFQTEDNGMIPLYASYVNTQISIMASPVVLDRVLRNPDVQKTQWYRDMGVPSVDDLVQQVSVSQRRRSELIDVGVMARKPADAKVLADAIVNSYMYYVDHTSEEEDNKLAKTLNEQYESLKEDIKALEGTIAVLRQNLKTGSPEQLLSQRIASLFEKETKFKSLTRELELARRRLQFMTDEQAGAKATAADASTQPSDASTYAADPEWRQRELALRTARHHVEVESARLGDSNPQMIQLVKGVELAEQLLRAREAQLDMSAASGAPSGTSGAALETTPAGLKRRIELLEVEVQLLQGDLEHEREGFQKDFAFAETLTEKNSELARKRELYEAVRVRKEQKEMERQVPGSIRVLSYADTPLVPYQDRRKLLAVVGGLAGLAVGMGLAYLRASFSPSVQRIDDVAPTMCAPLLGELPLARAWSPPTDEDHPLQNESIRMVRTALLRYIERNGGGVFALTSAGPKAGKTTVGVLLAKSLARCGKRVLLVDADLRNPSVASRMKIKCEDGLVGALSRHRSDDEVIVSEVMPNLSVLPVGRRTNELDPELLANGSFRSCLSRWRERFDIVLVDGPPVMPVADARILSRHADGTIMVVREGHCRREDVYHSLAALAIAGGKVVGTVFIGSSWRQGYRTKYYGYYGMAVDADKVMDVRTS